jgi:hypothetical protein
VAREKKEDAESGTINLHRLRKDTVGEPVNLPIIDPMLFGLLAVL